ncbi:hypothetical protein [Deinococcus soli (ex Cha et al. 2016)]|uniref:Uncharacterized protein n=2 Tax=Deinococcus soli (ex Cha et al. 2016) TaxID=1309411 RepID=A0ACC6KKP8_9DEIO|nr:hypothetical protein [Deinococcus soli (ex Cha et al. 2016)]MDR6218621.1 hypothetical protein [Deinococcus soli (ex Cha et al. 2016)]MDR6328418.1 hypothetical protein [Deinococcus soli (ex Cha et al. 2016)]MDR6753029.1 hypothetical protein [Deinococcus soli (ex Cha et al. 2016)]
MTLNRYELRVELLDSDGRTRGRDGTPNPPGTYVSIGHLRVAATPDTVGALCETTLQEWRASEGRRFSEERVRNARVQAHLLPGQPLRAADFYAAPTLRAGTAWETQMFIERHLRVTGDLPGDALERGPFVLHVTHERFDGNGALYAGYATMDGEPFAAFATRDYDGDDTQRCTYVTDRAALTRLAMWVASLQEYPDLNFTDATGPITELESFGGMDFHALLRGDT